MRLWLLLAAVNGMMSVALGAYGAHGLAGDAYAQTVVERAARYQMYHALALLAVAWLAEGSRPRLAVAAGAFFVLGIVLFSGALYAIGVAGLPAAPLAPYGGISFLFGWLMLAVLAVTARPRQNIEPRP